MRRRALGLAALLLAACGDRDEGSAGPPLPFNKVPPTLPRVARERTLAEWLERAQSPDGATRAEAPWALVELADEPGVIASPLEGLLADPDANVRYAACVAVGRSRSDLGATVYRRLVALLGAPERGLALAARTSVDALGARSVPALEEALGVDDAEQASRVLRALGEIGPEAAPTTERVLSLYAVREDLRSQAVWALERFGPSIAPALAKRLPQAGEEEAAVLLRLMPATKEALAAHADALVAAFRRPGLVRRATAELLRTAGAAALPLVERLAADADPDVGADASTLAAQIRGG